MKRGLWLLIVGMFVLPMGARADETERFGHFGEVTLYRETPHPSHVVLFVSGDGGWNLGVIDMAKSLAALDALVVGIDIRSYLQALARSSDACLYPAADFETLSQYLQKKLGFPSYRLPVLVGYSSGATLAYATLAQSPPNTFRGGISLGFCPTLDGVRSFCRGSGLVSKPKARPSGIQFDPIAKIDTPWIAFQGDIDQVCDAGATRDYVSRVAGAELVPLPKVGHGFSVQRNWMPQFREAFRRLVGDDDKTSATAPSSKPTSGGTLARAQEAKRAEGLEPVGDLPLVEVPATGRASSTLAFVASGDGGWASLDKQLAEVLASKGVAVVGLDTLQYYWNPHSPDESGRALERILRAYLTRWKKDRFLLIGYSRGASVLPFMASRLPRDLADRVDVIALLGSEKSISFEFKLTDWLGRTSGSDPLVIPEIEKLRGRKILCLYGADETDSPCRGLDPGLARSIELAGGHHFDGDYPAIAERILQQAAQPGASIPGSSVPGATTP